MLRLGITGGIGSGKSTVCRIFEFLDVPVYYADQRSKELVSTQPEIRKAIVHYFGEEAFKDGIYNRPYMAGIVFKDKSKLELLNGIIHPFVLKDWDEFCSKYAHLPYIIKEAAIMLETESRNSIDKVALVYAPKELRIQRVLERDHIEKAAVEARMNMQMPEEEKLKKADIVIYNDGEHSLIEQVLKLHSQLSAS